MATTEHFRNGGGTTLPFTFPILANSDLKVEIYNASTGVWDLKTENSSGQTNNDYTISNTNVVFNSATPSGTGNVHIYRTTNVDNPQAVFAAGSSIRAVDLNNNQTQVLYSTQEAVGQLVRETDLKDSIVTSAKIANGAIVNDDINANAEIAVSKLADGSARQLLQTDAAGSGVEWSSNIDIPGTLDVTGNVDLDANLNVDGNTTLDATTVDGVLDVNGSATIDAITIDSTSVSSSGHLALNGTRIDLNSNTDINLDGNLKVRPNGTTSRFSVLDSVIYAYEDLHPGTTNSSISTYNLGASLARWNTVYADTISPNKFSGSGIVDTGVSTTSDQVYSCKRAEERFYGIGTAADIVTGNTWESSSSKVATTDAIDARIIDLVDDVGGFVPIANETSFPNANPDVNNGAGTLVSVPLANNLTSNGSGVITIANGTVGNSTVTITGATASSTFAQGFGIIVETTSTLNTYTFHRYVPKATEVTTVATNITNITTVAGEISPTNNIAAVAGKATEIGRLGTADAVADLAILGTADVVADMNLLGTTDVVADMALLATTDVIADMNLLATSAVVEDMSLLGTTDCVADMALLGTNDVIADMALLATTDVIADMALLGTSDVVNDLSILGTADVVNDMNVLATTTNVNDINLVAGSIGNVNNVGGAIGNVANVAGSLSNVNTVGNNIASVNNVNTNISHVTTVSGISGNVSTVAGISGNVTTVAQDATDIGNVATNIGNVNTTAANIANVNAVGSNISNVNTVAANNTNINTAATYLNDFQSLYLGAASSAPVTDGVGNSVTEGDLYFNSGNKQLQVFNGSVFTSIFDTALDFAKAATAAFNALYTASAGSNSIDLGGLAISGAAFSNEAVATNRVSLTKGSATYNLGGI